eukprot:TRINITY_DN48158_c0_g1_i1.p1 TRINITY_DN48158_c0_g1~~TRINITY_DN48158_c0_g1_i1.p1  ORF type:complete len:128 (-),score=26.09 TRINITY_DN48158_c0_g1_i1:92-475(-)
MKRTMSALSSTVRELHLHNTVWPSGFAEYLPAALHTLTLGSVDGLSDIQGSTLAARFSQLKTLNPTDTRCGDITCSSLAALSLTSLDLSCTRTSDAGLASLSSGAVAGTLLRLLIGGTLVTLSLIHI